MKKFCFVLISLICLVPGISFAATQTIHIDWDYDDQVLVEKTLAGYNLYQEGKKICTTNIPSNRTMDCSFDSEDGTFDFTLTAFDIEGNESPHSAPYSFTLTTPPAPELISAFGTTPTILKGEVPFVVNFDATASSGNISSYDWNFGDNSTGNGIQTTHIYTSTGTFNTTLTVTDSDNVSNTKSVSVTVDSPPVADISTNPTQLTGDIPLTIAFSGSASTGDIASYSWDFGDNNTANGSLVNHTFSNPGTYTTTLTVTSTHGTTSQESVTVNVSALPVATITTNPTSQTGDVPFAISFDGSSSTGDISSYTWDFGDNSSASGSQPPTHTYTEAGTYNTTLTVTSNTDATSQKSVTINVSPLPVAAITTNPASQTGDIPFVISFDGSSSTGDISSYTWDFGDNNTASGSQPPTHTYTEAGTYNVTLVVTSNTGSTSQKNIAITATTASTPANLSSTHEIHLELTYDYQSIEEKSLAGYHLYKEGVKICTNTTPTTRDMNCRFESLAGTFNFTLTAFDTDGNESPHSVPYPFTLTTSPELELAASIITTPTTLTGDAPFTILFDGSSSIGANSYTWAFGDGNTASTGLIEHTFIVAGTYTTALTITDAEGHTNITSVSVNVNETIANNIPPSAVIESSQAVGEAPLTVTFDGAKSQDTDGSIISYLWHFGDGSQAATGESTTYRYTVAGTYNASLTVTDNQGATDTTTTPVLIQQSTSLNQAPTARLITSSTEGAAPLTVTFDGSSSSAPEGSALSYIWNFGDGSSAQGATTSHIYTTPGTFTATLTVTDDLGLTSAITAQISVDKGTSEFRIELGEIDIDHNWTRINFSDPFINPIVVAGPSSYNGRDPSIIRLKNISSTGFDIRIQEWNYLNDYHCKETVAYLVMEQGSFTLADGTKIEAGQATSKNTDFQTVQFNTNFTVDPVVMTSIATFNEEDTAIGRLRNISTTSFEHKIQEQELLSDGHGSETVNYIACEPFQNAIGPINVIVNKTADIVTDSWYTVDFGKQLSDIPIFLGTMQSQDGTDTSSIRYTNKTNTEIQIKIEEEQSADAETTHTSEKVGYFLFFSN